MGQPDFRVGGGIFATLASAKQGYGNLQLSLEQQAAFVEELPGVFLPIPGGWGRMGMTHIRLAAAPEDVLTGALRTAWKLRVIPASAWRCGGEPVSSTPPSRQRPASGAWKPLMQSMVVLLPEPFGPMRPMMAPASTVKLKPSTAVRP